MTLIYRYLFQFFINKDEDNSPKTFNDKNHQASSQKFRQLDDIYIYIYIYILGCVLYNFRLEKQILTIHFKFPIF